MAANLDPDVEIMYLCPGHVAYSKDQITVSLSRDHDRKRLPDEDEAAIESTWSNRMSQNPKLWNGTKFRLDSVVQNDGCVSFNLGLTCYKDFLGTNWSASARRYQTLGGQEHNNSQAYMSDALGVGALVHTADDCFILLRRSQQCGEAVGLLDIPGGHPEPHELVGKLDLSEINISEMSAVDVREEIFQSTLLEIVDEVNIPKKCLSYPKLLGIARNTTSSGRPSSEYYCRCSMTSAEIQQRYLTGGHKEANESLDIMFVPMATIPTLQENKSLWSELAPSAKGCLTLYRRLCASK